MVWIDKQAATSNVSRSKKIHDLLAAQQRIQQEISKSFTLAPEDGDGTQILHVALQNQTETVCATIERWVGKPLQAALLTLEKLKAAVTLTNELQMTPQQYDQWWQKMRTVREELEGNNGRQK
jgi:hypothetical protein